jgi:histidinol dehydrogenase
MRCERFVLGGDPSLVASELRALVPAPESVSARVSEIIGRVRAEGDAAVREYTRQFDTGGADAHALTVDERALSEAEQALDPAVRAGLERAIENVRRVARVGVRGDEVVRFDGHTVTARETPVDRAGIYVPGGRAPYPSTVVMGVVTAVVAGVPEVVVCAPPGHGGGIDSTVLAACRLSGASAVYAMGGAQAIAAVAYGTESVAPVDVIVGPGNLYVQEAKRQVFGRVAIDGFAGPSDLLLVADGGADPEPLALDLLAQAEHGPGTLVVGASPSQQLLSELQARVSAGPDTGAVAALVETADLEQALGLAQALAPEHLELVGPGAEELAPRATHAGCVFVGAASATAFGDYVAGSNHVLPTNGAARFASALSAAHFRRRFTEVRIGNAAGELARTAAPVARAEGFEVHARSMEARIRENGLA